MNAKRLAAAMLSAVFVTGNAAAAERCASAEQVATLEVAAMQQQMMVAAYTCHDVRAYNRFVLAYRPELQRSDRAMLKLFEDRDGDSAGFAEYNAFKTKLANLSALHSTAYGDGFCSQAASEFDAARQGHRPLLSLVSDQPNYADLPFTACDAPRYASADEGRRTAIVPQRVSRDAGPDDGDASPSSEGAPPPETGYSADRPDVPDHNWSGTTQDADVGAPPDRSDDSAQDNSGDNGDDYANGPSDDSAYDEGPPPPDSGQFGYGPPDLGDGPDWAPPDDQSDDDS